MDNLLWWATTAPLWQLIAATGAGLMVAVLWVKIVNNVAEGINERNRPDISPYSNTEDIADPYTHEKEG